MSLGTQGILGGRIIQAKSNDNNGFHLLSPNYEADI